MIYFKNLQTQFISAYGVGSGNAPALITSAGHLRAVFNFLNRYETHLSKSYFYGCYAYC